MDGGAGDVLLWLVDVIYEGGIRNSMEKHVRAHHVMFCGEGKGLT